MPDVSQYDKSIIVAFIALFAAIFAALITFTGNYTVKKYEQKSIERKSRREDLKNYYYPLMRVCLELDGRIGQILSVLEYDWLSAEHLEKIKQKKGFAINPLEKGYFLLSTLFLFAQFFGCIEIIKHGVGARILRKKRRAFKFYGVTDLDLYDNNETASKNKIRNWFAKARMHLRQKMSSWINSKRDNFYYLDPTISRVSKAFQYKEIFDSFIKKHQIENYRDCWTLHKQFQYSIGQLMIDKKESTYSGIKSFLDFFNLYTTSDDFRFWFIPLEAMIVDLIYFPKGDIQSQVLGNKDLRPLRLLAIRYWCRVLMEDIAHETKLKSPPAIELLKNLSPDVSLMIRSITLSNLDSFLGAPNINT